VSVDQTRDAAARNWRLGQKRSQKGGKGRETSQPILKKEESELMGSPGPRRDSETLP